MGALATARAKEEAKAQAMALEKTTPAEDKATINVLKGVLGAGLQGVTFGYSDEAIAMLKSTFGDEAYEEVRDKIRADLDKFKDEETALAYGAEIAGSLATPAGALKVANMGFKALANAAPAIAKGVGAVVRPVLGGTKRQAMASGALYGSGVAKEMEDVPLSAATGAAVGLGASALLPYAGSAAKRILQKGGSLSAGEKYGGLIGGLEALAQRLPALQGFAPKRATLTQESLAPMVYGGVMETLGKKLPTGLSAQKAYSLTKEAFNESYERALKDVAIPIDRQFGDDVASILSIGEMKKVDEKKFRALVDRFYASAKDGKVSGDSLKAIQTDINAKLRALGEPTDAQARVYVNSLKNLGEAMMESFARADTPKSALLRQVNQAYAQFKPLEIASFKAGTAKAGAFTEKQLDTEIQRQAQKRQAGVSSFIKGERFGQDILRDLAEVEPTVVGGVPMASVLATGSQLAPQAADVAATGILGGIASGAPAAAFLPAAGAVALGSTKAGRALMSPRVPSFMPVIGGKPFGGIIDVPSAAGRSPAVTGGLLAQQEQAQDVVGGAIDRTKNVVSSLLR